MKLYIDIQVLNNFRSLLGFNLPIFRVPECKVKEPKAKLCRCPQNEVSLDCLNLFYDFVLVTESYWTYNIPPAFSLGKQEQ